MISVMKKCKDKIKMLKFLVFLNQNLSASAIFGVAFP